MNEIKAFLLPSASDRQWSFVYRQLLRFPPSNPSLASLPVPGGTSLGICEELMEDGALTGSWAKPKIAVLSYFPSLHLSLEKSHPASPTPAFHKSHCWHWESASSCPGSLQQGKISHQIAPNWRCVLKDAPSSHSQSSPWPKPRKKVEASGNSCAGSQMFSFLNRKKSLKNIYYSFDFIYSNNCSLILSIVISMKEPKSYRFTQHYHLCRNLPNPQTSPYLR